MAWITPIIDRNQMDVIYALANQNSVMGLKGSWNISDVNRIINNIQHLNTKLAEQNYYPNTNNIPNWVMTDLPHVNSKVDIIRDNVNKIVYSFYKLNNPNIRYGTVFDFNDANALEINLKITNDLLESLIANYKYSGTFSSGEDLVL